MTKTFYVVVGVTMTYSKKYPRIQRDAEQVVAERILNGRTAHDYQDMMIIEGLASKVVVSVIPEVK